MKKTEINREHARLGQGQNKLCTHRTFRTNFETETYVNVLLPFAWYSSFAKFGAGVVVLRLETGRYENFDVFQLSWFNQSIMHSSNILCMNPVFVSLSDKKNNQTAFNNYVSFLSKSGTIFLRTKL